MVGWNGLNCRCHRVLPSILLQSTPYEQLVTWQFADFVLTFPSDWFSTVNKLRRSGFHGMHIDSDAMFASLFERMREQKVIP